MNKLAEKGPANAGPQIHCILAAKTAQLAEDLPNSAAIGSTVVIAIEEEHLADLLLSICLAKTKGL